MRTVRIKARIVDDFTRTTAKHIKHSDLPETYTADDKFIYKDVPLDEYANMLTSPDGIHMSELGIAAVLDTDNEL